ncbi:hypothetical protein APT58_08335 [Corynebacterium glutamicum]|nr:hypothetical protein APT58_08335 [Corynebacterium glutamicum]
MVAPGCLIASTRRVGDVVMGVVHRWGDELLVSALSLLLLGAGQGIGEVTPGFLQCFNGGLEALADAPGYFLHRPGIVAHGASFMEEAPLEGGAWGSRSAG